MQVKRTCTERIAAAQHRLKQLQQQENAQRRRIQTIQTELQRLENSLQEAEGNDPQVTVFESEIQNVEQQLENARQNAQQLEQTLGELTTSQNLFVSHTTEAAIADSKQAKRALEQIEREISEQGDSELHEQLQEAIQEQQETEQMKNAASGMSL